MPNYLETCKFFGSVKSHQSMSLLEVVKFNKLVSELTPEEEIKVVQESSIFYSHLILTALSQHFLSQSENQQNKNVFLMNRLISNIMYKSRKKTNHKIQN